MVNEVLAILMALGFFGMLLIGFPVAIALAAAGLLFGYLGFGPGLFNLLPLRIFGVVTNYTLMAIPLFVFMGVMLERSRLAEELLDVVGHLAGGLRGGMGLSIILVGVLMGASTGIVGATVVTLGLLTLPVFLRRGYAKWLACGTICASGTLGQIIPPSLVLILLADILGESVGTLFAAAMVPGLLLAGFYAVYMIAVGYFDPRSAPAIPKAERMEMSRRDLAGKTVRVVLPPLLLIVAVLGSIIGGIAAPTEAASMGALGSILVVAIAGRLTGQVLTETVRNTLKISAMVFFILICAQAFSLAFRGLNGEDLVKDMFKLVPGGHRRHRIHAGDPVHPRVLFGMDRNLLHRAAALPAGARRHRRQHGVAGDPGVPEPPIVVPDAAGRLVAVLPERRGAARGDDPRHLRRRHSVRHPASSGAGGAFLLPGTGAVAAESDRLVAADAV